MLGFEYKEKKITSHQQYNIYYIIKVRTKHENPFIRFLKIWNTGKWQVSHVKQSLTRKIHLKKITPIAMTKRQSMTMQSIYS